MDHQLKLLWEQPDWQKQAHDWIRTESARHSIQITGEIEQPYMFAWSTVLRATTNVGMIFFKATASELMREFLYHEKMLSG